MVNFEKSFDAAKYDRLVEFLRRFGVNGADIRIITRFYCEPGAVVRVDDDASGWVNKVHEH